MSALQMRCLCICREYSITGKTRRAKENGTTPLSVATNIVVIQSNPPTEFQLISQSGPSIWERPCNKGTDHQISNLEEAINRDILRPYRQKCSEDLIFSVRSQLKVEGDSIRLCRLYNKINKNSNSFTVFSC